MANLFQPKPASVPSISPQQALRNKYATSRANLLVAVLFTALNLILLLLGGDMYMLFSIFLPYFLGGIGMAMCGKFPAEYYADMGEMEFLGDSFLIAMVVLAFIIIGVYLLAYFLSKKMSGWLITALVLFSIDTLLLLLAGNLAESILDIVFHAWVLYYLIVGIISAKKLKNMPEEETTATVVPEGETNIDDNQNSI